MNNPTQRTRNWRARALRIGLVAGVGALLVALALWPTTVRVDSTVAKTDTVRETFEAEGRTRVRDRYVITAPLAGTIRRIDLSAGDAVKAGQALVTLDPVATPTLDARTRAQAQAQLAAAEAQLATAEAEEGAAREAASLARSELQRQEALAAQSMVSQQALQQARTLQERADWQARSARFQVATAKHQVSAAQAVLQPGGPQGAAPGTTAIRSPVDGVVLRRHAQSARPVQAGEPLLDIGDPAALEVEVDVLSSDAVRLNKGAAVELLRWGGGPVLQGAVARVEPGAFTKTSALGVEEQRVWVTVELLSPREQWSALGEAYRVHARFVLRSVDGAVTIPSGALFRPTGGDQGGNKDRWAVFRVEGGKARLRDVRVGLQGEGRVQVTNGLNAGDEVVLHPPRELSDGQRVKAP